MIKHTVDAKFFDIYGFAKNGTLHDKLSEDSFRKSTCLTTSGLSLVDVVIISEKFYNHILYFCVGNFEPTLSKNSANVVTQSGSLYDDCKLLVFC